MNINFWIGRRVLLTGHTGFKGGWLAIWLSRLGAQVTGLSLPPSLPSLYDAADISKCAKEYFFDIRDAQAVSKIVTLVQPEIVFHLAAQPLVRSSYLNPLETYATNVMGTANLLDAVRLNSPDTRSIVVVTTDKCYQNKENIWGYRETDPLGGHDPYSSSKAASELVAHSYAQSYFNSSSLTSLATARAGNVIGGGDFAADRLFPDLIRACEKRENLVLRYPQAIRPWQHVLEPLAGYLRLAKRLFECGNKFSGAWNFGPDEASFKPVSWVVNHFIDKWGSEISWEKQYSEQPYEAGILKLDCTKAAHFLEWRPIMGLEQSIDLVISWHKAQIEGKKMKEFSDAQILNYINLSSKFQENLID